MIECLGQTVRIVVDELTKVGDARRQTTLLARQLGFDETHQGKAALIATEIATNLVKHAGGGELLVQAHDDPGLGTVVQLTAIDAGPGMKDINQCLSDGYSTAGSSGTGLGAIRRIADTFDLFSRPGLGTVLSAQVSANPGRTVAAGPPFQIGVVRVPCPGEQLCGDAWAAIERGENRLIMVVDGLGHGPSAAEAADEAVRVFRGHRSQEPAEILNTLHEALRATRGAALAITRIDPVDRRVHYAGVGNIAAVLINGLGSATTSMVSQNGTVGYTIRRIQTFEYPWLEDSILLMHSDGLATRWQLDRYRGVAQCHPTLLAAILYRDFKRGRDDTTVLVARSAGAPPT